VGKGMHGYGLRFWKLKILVKTRFVNNVIMFKETLEFKVVILLCYGKEKTLSLQQSILKAQVWAIAKIILACLNLVVIICVLNQSRGHWLLFDILMIKINVIVTMESQPNSVVNGNETCD